MIVLMSAFIHQFQPPGYPRIDSPTSFIPHPSRHSIQPGGAFHVPLRPAIPHNRAELFTYRSAPPPFYFPYCLAHSEALPRRIFSPCSRLSSTNPRLSRTALRLPGRLTIRVFLRITDTPRLSMARLVIFMDS